MTSRGREPRAAIKENVALGKILTTRPDMTARGGLGHGDDPVGRYRVLLNDDGIRASRHRRAGIDPHRFAGTNLATEAGSRRGLANHREARRQCRHIRGAHRIPIHGRGIEGRLRQAGGEILGEHAAESASASGTRSGSSGSSPSVTRARASATESSAMSSQRETALKGPERPPVFSIKRMPEKAMPRSTALHMS